MAVVDPDPDPVVGPARVVVGPGNTFHMVCSGLDVAHLPVVVCFGLAPGSSLLGSRIPWWISTSEPSLCSCVQRHHGRLLQAGTCA